MIYTVEILMNESKLCHIELYRYVVKTTEFHFFLISCYAHRIRISSVIMLNIAILLVIPFTFYSFFVSAFSSNADTRAQQMAFLCGFQCVGMMVLDSHILSTNIGGMVYIIRENICSRKPHSSCFPL